MAKLENRQRKTLTCTVCKEQNYRTEKNVKNTIGICYDFQLADEIPIEEFDRKLSRIITEKRDIKGD